jgi:hypothetical protein
MTPSPGMASRASWCAPRRGNITPILDGPASLERLDHGPASRWTCSASAESSWLRRRGQYEIVHGTLGDLDRLTEMRGVEELKRPRQAEQKSGTKSSAEKIEEGRRTNWLLRQCMQEAPRCGTRDALIDVARDRNANCIPPLEEEKVMEIVNWAWSKTEQGLNHFGQHGAWFSMEEVAAMLADQDAFVLLAFLRANNGPESLFMCTNGLAEKFGWDRRKLAAARRRLIELHYVKPIRQAGRGHPALFRWAY